MSEPRNHHYVSQVLIRKFLDSENKLYYYDKRYGSFGETKSTRFLFSEKDLNSTINENGEVDHSSVEETLNRHFENDFNNHYDNVISAISTKNYNELTQSLAYLMRMGIVGEMRTPQQRTESQNIILGTFEMITKYATDELKEKIERSMQRTSNVKNKIPINYKEISKKVTELMGEIIYSIFEAPQDFYLLPDCTSVVFRDQLEDDSILNGEVLLNLNRPIATVIFPINSKVIIVAQSAKICPQKSHGIYTLSSDTVYNYNKMFFEKSNERVVCQNKEYLKNFIEKYNNSAVLPSQV